MIAKKLLILTGILVLLFGFAACSSTDNVQISITYPGGSNQNGVESIEIEVPKDSTVLDVLDEYAGAQNLEIITSGDPAYVTGIGGINNTDTQGWIYTLNEEIPKKEPGRQKVENKDVIIWTFGDKADMQDGGQ